MKVKQETPFPIPKERTRGRKTAHDLLAYSYQFLWCFDIKVLYVKLLQTLLLIDAVTSTWRIAADLIYAYRKPGIW